MIDLTDYFTDEQINRLTWGAALEMQRDLSEFDELLATIDSRVQAFDEKQYMQMMADILFNDANQDGLIDAAEVKKARESIRG